MKARCANTWKQHTGRVLNKVPLCPPHKNVGLWLDSTSGGAFRSISTKQWQRTKGREAGEA